MIRWKDELLDLLYPTKCVLCRCRLQPGVPTICPACRESMPRADSIRTRGDYFSECVSVLRYEGTVKEAIRRYKFGDAQAYCHAFGELVAAAIYAELDGRYDALSWVPLAPDRLHERGYDQVELMALDVGKRLCVTPVPLLKKRRGVDPQSGTASKEERRANIAGAYSLRTDAHPAGKRVLLIDDVVTTGSTLSECAKTLLIAGAEEVLCATLAVA